MSSDDEEAAVVPNSFNNNNNDGGSSPSYLTTKSHVLYTAATMQLKDGDFEGCMASIETLMGIIRDQLGGDEVHEALAPLYYLYGSTLLYSVEESDDLVAPPAPAAAASGEENAEEDHGGSGGGNDIPVSSSVTEMGSSNENDATANNFMDAQLQQMEDLQIAWENLDLSRTIMERMNFLNSVDGGNKKSDFNDVYSEEQVSILTIDMALNLCRLGDLQMANGKYDGAIQDYTHCLQLRETILGKYNRKVADCHYSIGSCYLLLAGASTSTNENHNENNEAAAVMGASTMSAAAASHQQSEQQPVLTKEQISAAKDKGIKHLLGAANSIAGQVEILCGLSPRDSLSSSKGDAAVSVIISSICDRVKKANSDDIKKNNEVNDLKELLDEIRETIDNADESQEVMRKDVSKLKANAEPAVGNESVKTASDLSPSTTVIGFGNSAATLSKQATTVPTMMVVKKKKKNMSDDCEKKTDIGTTKSKSDDDTNMQSKKKARSSET